MPAVGAEPLQFHGKSVVFNFGDSYGKLYRKLGLWFNSHCTIRSQPTIFSTCCSLTYIAVPRYDNLAVVSM